MQNFSPEHVMAELCSLRDAIERHIPVGEGTEETLAARVEALEKRITEHDDMVLLLGDRVQALEHAVFAAAGVGATEQQANEKA